MPLPRLWLLFAVLLFLNGSTAWSQEKTALSETQLADDLNQFADELPKRYADLFSQRPKQEFDAAVDALRLRLPSMDRQTFGWELRRITKAFTNGRTNVESEFSIPPLLTVRFKALEDGLFVSAVERSRRELIGVKLKRIGNLDAEDIPAVVGALVPHKNPSGLRRFLDSLGSDIDFLRAIGVEAKDDKVTITVEADGKGDVTFEAEVYSTGRNPPMQLHRLYGWIPGAYPMPQWFEERDKTLYFNCRCCRTANDLDHVIRRTEKALQKHKVKRFLLDLRRNSFEHPDEVDSQTPAALIDFFRNHKAINQTGRLFVVIGRGTETSGFIKLQELREKTKAIFVGEQPASKFTLYQQSKRFADFTLSNSNLKIKYLVPAEVEADRAETKMFAPDILVTLNSKAWFAYGDPFWKAVLEYKLKD